MTDMDVSELAILRRVIDPDESVLSSEAARAILRMRFCRADQDRMNELAARNRHGQLNANESEELDNYLHVGKILGILQSKARQSLAASEGQLSRQTKKR